MSNSYYKDKRVAVTGAAGTVGKEIVQQLLQADAAEVLALDNAETPLFFVEQEFNNPRLQCFLANIQDLQHLNRLFENIDYVFHVAAYKHVPACERHPRVAVENNIIGVQNVITAARDCKVKKVLFTSSDKAVNPTNVMGTSKLMGERLMTAANAISRGDHDTIFASTRFGNVAGSSGSVIQIFDSQIKQGKPITLTDSGMTRFMMTLEESVQLVLESLQISCGGEVFVTKMPVFKISDLAEVLVDELAPRYGFKPQDIEIKEVGIRPGEKLYEELTTDEEIQRTLEIDKMFIVLPAFRNIYKRIDYENHHNTGKKASHVYNSADAEIAGKEEVKTFLRELNMI